MNKRPSLFFSIAIIAILTHQIGACSKVPEPPSAAVAASAASAVAANVPDLEISSKVKSTLQQTDSLKAFDIGVETLKGDVRLTGVLDSQAQVDEAQRIARASEGVHSLHSELTVRK
jgi:osmotically-inducible protein OsmY